MNKRAGTYNSKKMGNVWMEKRFEKAKIISWENLFTFPLRIQRITQVGSFSNSFSTCIALQI